MTNIHIEEKIIKFDYDNNNINKEKLSGSIYFTTFIKEFLYQKYKFKKRFIKQKFINYKIKSALEEKNII